MKNNFTKIILSLFLVFSIAGTLFSCDTVEVKETESDIEISNRIKYDKVKDYKIIETEDGYRLVFDDPSIYESEECPYIIDLSFESVEELYNNLIYGKFDFYDKIQIFHALPKDEKGIIISDPNNFYLPILPDNNCEMRSEDVIWRGDYYSYGIEIPSFEYNKYAKFYYLTEERYNKNLEEAKNEYSNRRKSVKTEGEKEIITYQGDLTQVRYTVSDENKSMYVIETKDSQYDDGPIYSINAFYISKGVYFEVCILYVEESFTPEWLFEFDVEKIEK